MTRTIVIALGTLVFAAEANALLITPSDAIPGYYDPPSNCEPACVDTVFGTSALSLLYKGEVDSGKEEGSFASYYSTVFTNTSTDPTDATISWDGPLAILCSACYLAIKDGKQDPNYYFLDLSKWNGTETLYLSGFWPGKGAISHVSIWGKATSVPEPTTLSLLGAGLLALGLRRRRSRAR